MKNDLFTIGSFTIHGYGLMIGLGFLAAYFVSEYRAKKQGLDSEHLLSIAMWVLIPGWISAKLLYYITTWKDIVQNPMLLLDLSGGFVVYGGIIGGILGGYIYCKRNKVEFWKYFDLIIPSVALAQAFGRIGCLLAGCCYGLPMQCPISIIFQHSEFAPNGVPLLPTQIISSGLDFAHFLILILFAKHAKAEGQVSALYLIFYSVGRFVLEFFRGDLVRGSVGTLSTSQFISIFIFIAGCILFAVNTKLGSKKQSAQVEENIKK
ncbi:MAG: prolipoprotein diacylglyceryl transferase [Clostridium sp.]